MDTSSNDSSPKTEISMVDALKVWAKIGFTNFGGPAGQIALMHRLLVDEKRWISEERFLHALNYCMLLPGPEAQQLAIYIGWLLHRTVGGLMAGTLFVVPGAILIMVLSALYARFATVPFVQSLFFGVKAAVLVVVVEAVWRIGQRALRNPLLYAVAVIAFLAIFFCNAPFPLIILFAAIIGLIGGKFAPKQFDHAIVTGGKNEDGAYAINRTSANLHHSSTSIMRIVKLLAIGLTIWFAPLLALAMTRGTSSPFFQEGLFFSKLAVVTFGGGYAVLSYMAQEAVENYAWLTPGQMMDGLGLAETTPGPLILVVQYVAFMGAYQNPGRLDPLLAGVLASLLTLWVTFVPCFLWIFLGAPYIEKLRSNKNLSAALTGITAAVVGVILNLAVWFALHVTFGKVHELSLPFGKTSVPDWSTLRIDSVILSLVAAIAMFRMKVSMILTLVLCALVGIIWKYFFPVG